MKRSFLFFIIGVIILFTTSCYVQSPIAGNSGKIPPGQAKKMYGAQSARDFAPGHNK